MQTLLVAFLLIYALLSCCICNAFEITKSQVMKEGNSFGHVLSTPSTAVNANETTKIFEILQNVITHHMLQNYLDTFCFPYSIPITVETNFKIRKLLYSLDAQTPFLQITGIDQHCILQQAKLYNYKEDCFVKKPMEMGREYDLNISLPNFSSVSLTIIHSLTHPNQFYISKWLPTYTVATTSSTKPLHFSIISFNIQNYASQWKERLSIIRQQISSEHVHFVALQEVRWDETQPKENRFDSSSSLQISDLVHSFSAMNFSSFAYQSAMSYQKQYYWDYSVTIPRSEEGLAWFSQYQVLRYEYLHLGRNLSNWNSHQRIVQRIDILIPNSTKVITILNTHLPLEDEIRIFNFQDIEFYSEEIKKEYQSNTNREHLATILVGDLNQEFVTMPSASWIDAWKLVSKTQEEEQGLTFSTDGKYKKRIDYCFVKSSVAFQVPSFKVIRHPLHTLASDHYAIAVTLEWK